MGDTGARRRLVEKIYALGSDLKSDEEFAIFVSITSLMAEETDFTFDNHRALFDFYRVAIDEARAHLATLWKHGERTMSDYDILREARKTGLLLPEVLRNARENGGSMFEVDLIGWIEKYVREHQKTHS